MRIVKRAAPRMSMLLLAVLVAGALASSGPAAAKPVGLADAQARAAELEQQVSKLEERYDGLQERFRAVQYDLARVQRSASQAAERYDAAKLRLAAARRRLSQRAVSIYRTSDDSPLSELASAGSISAFFDREQATRQIGEQDAAAVEEVTALERDLSKRRRRLESLERKTDRLVKRVARERRTMARVLDERRAALDSAGSRVRAIMEEQRRREAARDAAAARARISRAAGRDDAAPTPRKPGSPAGSAADRDAPATPDRAPRPAASQGTVGSIRVPLPPASGIAARAAQIAVGKVGAPYVWAAAGPNSFDCSGLVVWAFAQAGRPGLPHSTYSLIDMGVSVSLSDAQPGDLIFTNNTGHMGIYVGGGNMVHSPRSGRTVTVEPLTYYTIVAIKRI